MFTQACQINLNMKFTAKTLQVLSLFYMYFVASFKSSFPTNRWMFVNCSGAC